MVLITEIIISTVLLIICVLFYKKQINLEQKAKKIATVDDKLIKIERELKVCTIILKITAISVFMPLVQPLLLATHQKMTSIIVIVGLGVFIKILDYIIKAFLKIKSKIIFLIFLSFLGFIIPYFVLLVFKYNLLETFKN